MGLARTLNETVSGTPVLEKQSRFLACGTPLSSGESPEGSISKLVKRYKMKKASHLSWAARFSDGSEMKNDGGESGSGNCILDVMRNMGAENCLILVARWYGGKHLGGMRFRIYRNTTRELLEKYSD